VSFAVNSSLIRSYFTFILTVGYYTAVAVTWYRYSYVVSKIYEPEVLL